MASYYVPEQEIAEFKETMRGIIREVITGELMPTLREYVNETVVTSAREAARCALTDEIDYISEKGKELLDTAGRAKAPPSQFKHG